MKNKTICKILAISIVLAIVASCTAMAPAEGISESDRKYASVTIYVPDDYPTIQDTANITIPRDTIVVYAAVNKLPDLVITDIWWSGSTIYYKIKNQGNAAAGPSTSHLYVDGSYKTKDPVNSINSIPARLVLTMEFDNDPDGYLPGDKVDIRFLDAGRFKLEDKYGMFYGGYTVADAELTLSFDEYPLWDITFNPDGTFTGSEHGYANGGTYEWLGEYKTESFTDYNWTCLDKTDTLKVCADATNRVAEGNETNNCKSEIWECPEPPLLLEIESIKVLTESIFDESPFDVPTEGYTLFVINATINTSIATHSAVVETQLWDKSEITEYDRDVSYLGETKANKAKTFRVEFYHDQPIALEDITIRWIFRSDELTTPLPTWSVA